MIKSSVFAVVAFVAFFAIDCESVSAQNLFQRIRDGRNSIAQDSQGGILRRLIARRQERSRGGFLSAERRERRRANWAAAFSGAGGGGSSYDWDSGLADIEFPSFDNDYLNSGQDSGFDAGAFSRKMEQNWFNRNYGSNPYHRAANGY